ncbi:MAG: helix-turn-helix domain-containing protein [Actinobacteria bacterium]|nr:helix-turn-helix domain-containing protein [Actinomycetota bacterium]
MSWADGAVCVESTFAVDVDWARDGMILTPSTVLTGRPAVVAEEPDPPQLIYPARGVGALWSTSCADHTSATADLLGTTRAAILANLLAPRTTQDLARQLELAPATVSFHLGILHRGGLVRRWRSGSRVWYEATELAAQLLG